MMRPYEESFQKAKPDEFYHLAGQSHVGISFEIPEVTTQEIANCTLKLLEICRDLNAPPKFIWLVRPKSLVIALLSYKTKVLLSTLLPLMEWKSFLHAYRSYLS